MSIDTAIRRFRERQAAQFTDFATIRRPVGEPTFDEDTGLATQEYETVGTLRPCKLTAHDPASRKVPAGETQLRVVTLQLKFPVEEDVQPDDIATITASTYNPTDVGKSYRIVSVDPRTWQISRLCEIEETLVPLLNEEEGS